MTARQLIINQLVLLFLVVGLIYSPAFNAEPCLLDDVALLRGLQKDIKIDLKAYLLPGSTELPYSRPLIGLSYWYDQTLWHANPHAMHIENVCFHLLNVILLFWLIRISLNNDGHSGRYAPFLGALLFAAHPVTTESVNWISGRTDLIGCACLISTTIALVSWRRKRNEWWLFLLAMLLLAMAIVSKEVAWGFLMVLPLFLATPYDSYSYTLTQFYETFSRLEKLLFLAGIALSFFLAAVLMSFWPAFVLSTILGLVALYRKPRLHPFSIKLYLLVAGFLAISVPLIFYGVKLTQKSAASGISSNLSRTLMLTILNIDNSASIFSAALAFYIKKFFLPLPLSFSITTIAPGYLFAGIAVFILTAFLAAWRSQAAILFLVGIALLLPSLPLAHNQIAWLPYAERYMYVSSAFWMASLAVGVNALNLPSLRASCALLCLLLIPTAAIITYKRSTVWQTNVALFGDTVQKSPNHIEARVLYMTALSKAGRMTEAVEEFERIQADPRSWVRVKYFNDLTELLYNCGQKQEAWKVLESSLGITLPLGQKHPLKNEDWQRLYKFHAKLRQELFPPPQNSIEYPRQ